MRVDDLNGFAPGEHGHHWMKRGHHGHGHHGPHHHKPRHHGMFPRGPHHHGPHHGGPHHGGPHPHGPWWNLGHHKGHHGHRHGHHGLHHHKKHWDHKHHKGGPKHMNWRRIHLMFFSSVINNCDQEQPEVNQPSREATPAPVVDIQSRMSRLQLLALPCLPQNEEEPQPGGSNE